jgi:NADPH:quinone reductase-like Zn-dependent oxidoreductase
VAIAFGMLVRRGCRSDHHRSAWLQAAWRQIVGRLDATAKRPVVDRVFAFGDVKVAFARLAQGPMGKVLVRVTA